MIDDIKGVRDVNTNACILQYRFIVKGFPLHTTLVLQVEMRLNVENLAEEDFGNYTCIAKNPRGNVTGVITLTGSS